MRLTRAFWFTARSVISKVSPWTWRDSATSPITLLMSLFDFYIMVDWSGAARRRGQRSDTIWVAHGSTTEDAPLTDSPFSRTEAIRLIRSLLLKEIAARKRVLVGFDFAYGYPVDFAAALQAAIGRSDQELPWLTVWRYLSEAIKDDKATTPGGSPVTAAIALRLRTR